MEDLVNAIEAAITAWVGCDWTHNHPDSETHCYCEGGNENNCEYCAAVVESAKVAALWGRVAIRALRGGDHADAVIALEKAVSMEDQWGDCPTWGPVLSQCEQLADKETP